MAIAGITRELLVRYLDVWTPAALHSARGPTFAMAWSGAGEATLAEAALRVFAEFADRLRGRRLTVVLVAPAPTELLERLDPVQRELDTGAWLSVHSVAGDGGDLLPVALTAASAAGAPLLAYLDGFSNAAGLSAVAAGRPGELLLRTAAGVWPEERRALERAGFPLAAGVDLVGSTDARLIGFATSSVKSLEAFKNALWSVDGYGGVRYRDPGDPHGHLLDISLHPHPGPLRRELLAHLAQVGQRTVTELRRFTLTDTVYRASDTTAALSSLLAAGAVTRDPPGGRLAGDVVITAAAGG